MTRVFELKPAVREQVPLIVGLVGPTGSGKTFSALELATGFQEVFGGDIAVMDTEAGRAKTYADFPLFSDPKKKFKFLHSDFQPPFHPQDYRLAGETAIKKGVKHLIFDSTTHMWEGAGGVQEIHDVEVERLKEAWHCTAETASFPAWRVAKGIQTKFIDWMKQQKTNFIFCFRAKEKMKMIDDPQKPGKKKPVEIGWQAVGGEDLLYEMALACLLLPGSDGQPIWNKAEEKGVKALHAEFRPMFVNNPRLSSAVGRALATWAKGDAVAPLPPSPPVAKKEAV